jgi:hypothetical protein
VKVTFELEDADLKAFIKKMNRIAKSPHGQEFFETVTAALAEVQFKAAGGKIYDRPPNLKPKKAKKPRRGNGYGKSKKKAPRP